MTSAPASIERPPVSEPWSAYLDIETATLPSVLALRAKAAQVMEWEIEDWTAEHAADGALSPLTGGVVAWAVADSRDRESVSVLAPDQTERDLLLELEQCLVGAARIFTFNGSRFDVPFLRARALALGVPGLARALWQGKPWEERIVDAAEPAWCPRPPGQIKGWTLDATAELFGIARPKTLPGEDVPAAFYAGRLDEIRTHVLDDVRTLRGLVRIWSEGRP